MKKIRLAFWVAYATAGITVIWCGLVVGRLAELGFVWD
jgi:hypothetical protein